ncbi:MAG: DUF2306 domain-containing protein [Bacteroidetes bacterium]|nr:DUF2306 domain-containing protein [Bacteroidota bacterium]
MQRVYKILRIVYWLLIIVFSILIIYNSFPYYFFDSSLLKEYAIQGKYVFLLEKSDLLDSFLWRASFYVHITGAMICIISGIPQFFRSILRKYKSVHNGLGKIYIASVLNISCPAGFYLSFFTKGGALGVIPFMSIAILWFTTTFVAYKYIRAKNYYLHSLWMVRSFAITLSAVTFRIFQILLYYGTEIAPIDNYIASLWLSLFANVVFGEIAVLYYKKYIFKRTSSFTLR